MWVVHGRSIAACLLAAALVVCGAWAGRRAWADVRLAAAVGSLRGRIVAIDPGHGGIDPGAIGGHGVNEDTIVLAVSLDLAHMLQHAGAKPVVTRGGPATANAGAADTLVAAGPSARRRVNLRERVALVEAAHADVLVSIHANHYSASSAHGAQTFYSANREAESRALAEMIQTQLAPLTGTRRGVSEHIAHYVLEHSTMPAVTVEIGFLSNPAEASRLEEPAYQQKVAYAVFLALAFWFARHHTPVAQG